MSLRMAPCADGLKRAHADVVAERHGSREMLPADARFFADRQRGRHDGAAGMRASAGVVVVGFIGMSEFAVGDGRLDGAEENIRSHHRADIRAAVGAGKFQGHASGRKLGAGNHGGKGIEDVVLGFLQHFFGQRGVAGFAHVSAELEPSRG